MALLWRTVPSILGFAMSRPLVLLSNDDGVRATGLHILREALLEIADVITVAPEHEQSATSHALSLHRPLRFAEIAPSVFAVDGTPADCVYVALFASNRFLPRRPSVVVSGLNRGLNLGADVHYSGTVAAAREAALRKVRSLAFSADLDADVAAAARLARRIVTAVLEDTSESPLFLNINFPAGNQWQLRQTRLGSRTYHDGVEIRVDPRGREYLWLGGPLGFTHGAEPDTDTAAFDAGFATITPLSLNPWDNLQQERALSIVEAVNERYA
jgi:5'-nucleotidase